MPVARPDSPSELLQRFLNAGWQVVDTGSFNSLVALVDAEGDAGEPFVIPMDGDEIGIETMRQAHGRLNPPGLLRSVPLAADDD